MTVHIQHAQVRLFAERLKDVAPTARKNLRVAIRDAGKDLTDALRGAYSWSSRIPGAVEMKVGFGSRGGVRVGVNAAKAPHARPHEFPSDGTMIRHPVFGNRENWVSTPANPTFFKTVRSKEKAVVDRVGKAIDDSLKAL